jgi:hypothetical protein
VERRISPADTLRGKRSYAVRLYTKILGLLRFARNDKFSTGHDMGIIFDLEKKLSVVLLPVPRSPSGSSLANGGNPQDRSDSPVPRSLFPNYANNFNNQSGVLYL